MSWQVGDGESREPVQSHVQGVSVSVAAGWQRGQSSGAGRQFEGRIPEGAGR